MKIRSTVLELLYVDSRMDIQTLRHSEGKGAFLQLIVENVPKVSLRCRSYCVQRN